MWVLLPGVWWSSSSRSGVCRPSSVCQPSAVCRRSTTSTLLCKCSKAKGSTSRMNTVIVVFLLSKPKNGDAQPERMFALHKMRFSFYGLMFSFTEVVHIYCIFILGFFPPLWNLLFNYYIFHFSMNTCHFTAHLFYVWSTPAVVQLHSDIIGLLFPFI